MLCTILYYITSVSHDMWINELRTFTRYCCLEFLFCHIPAKTVVDKALEINFFVVIFNFIIESFTIKIAFGFLIVTDSLSRGPFQKVGFQGWEFEPERRVAKIFNVQLVVFGFRTRYELV